LLDFKQYVIKIINSIPEGRVASYGQVAAMAGSPRAARQVGGILNRLDDGSLVPWWRVINNTGKITIKDAQFTPFDQKERLESEGVIVSNSYHIDINKYRYMPEKRTK
jgi:methylated-DNA-protein-cysteine methyltransferase related protein